MGSAVLLAAGLSGSLHAEQAAHTFTQPRLDAFAAAMAQEVEQGRIGGIATLVYQNGEVVQRAEYGYADREQQRPLEPDSLYKIFSLTKLVTGAALLTLYDEGRFELDEPVGKYIPELQNLQVAVADGPEGMPKTEPAAHPVTIRELMTHTGGFTYGRFGDTQVDQLYVQADIRTVTPPSPI
ncbi:serine hydrolase domain-containing protein [Halopseudomonas pachastrellae]|nr:serine hydrolase domain-containing protein [Halopseudomonas pachastrellae]